MSAIDVEFHERLRLFVTFLAARISEEIEQAQGVLDGYRSGDAQSAVYRLRSAQAMYDRLSAYRAAVTMRDAGDDSRWREGQIFALRWVAQTDAAVWKDHAGYDPSWAPTERNEPQ